MTEKLSIESCLANEPQTLSEETNYEPNQSEVIPQKCGRPPERKLETCQIAPEDPVKLQQTPPESSSAEVLVTKSVDSEAVDSENLFQENLALFNLCLSRMVEAKEQESRPVCNRSDTGNAALFLQKYGKNIRYNEETGFLLCKGKRWGKDEEGIVKKGIKTCIEQIPNIVRKAPEVEAWVTHSLSKARRDSVYNLVKSDAEVVSTCQLNSDPFLFNVANGTLDLRTAKLLPHSPADLITQISPVVFDAEANCPLHDEAILKICDGDPAKVRFLQTVFGYTLTGFTREQCFFLFVGAGANGKSLLLELMSALMGDYFQHTRPNTFLRNNKDAIPQDIAKLHTARMVMASESNPDAQFDEALLKSITGDSRITARFPYGKDFTYTPQFKTFFASNSAPRVRGTDHGIWRRMRLLKFNVRFWDADQGESGLPELQADKRLKEKLESEMSGILNWALEGCLIWQKEGLQIPDAVKADTKEYRESNDFVAHFLEERCELNPSFKVTKGDLHTHFLKWAHENGVSTSDFSKNEFGTILDHKDFKSSKSGSVRSWIGIRLQMEEEEVPLSNHDSQSI